MAFHKKINRKLKKTTENDILIVYTLLRMKKGGSKRCGHMKVYFIRYIL